MNVRGALIGRVETRGIRFGVIHQPQHRAFWNEPNRTPFEKTHPPHLRFGKGKLPPIDFISRNAQQLFKVLPPPVNTRVGNFSLEDLTMRLMVVLAIYLPQGISAIRYRQHPYETWGRNIFAFLGSVGVASIAKHPKYGFNSLFNQFMMPQRTHVEQAFLLKPPQKGTLKKIEHYLHQRFEAIINPLRPKVNYLELFHQAGINLKTIGYKGELTPKAMREAVQKSTFWTNLDLNEKFRLQSLRNRAALPLRRKTIDGIIKRISLCKYLSVAFSSIIFAYVIGILLQKAVFKYIAPLDKHFVPRTRNLGASTPGGAKQ